MHRSRSCGAVLERGFGHHQMSLDFEQRKNESTGEEKAEAANQSPRPKRKRACHLFQQTTSPDQNTATGGP
jgi:hypothetical protein